MCASARGAEAAPRTQGVLQRLTSTRASSWCLGRFRAPGRVATERIGPALYTFDRDAAGSGRSVCNGPCATNWPPLAASAGANPTGDWSIVVRDDGTRQWAYKGKPVYYWVKDAKPGDRTGDGFNGVWRVARP